MLKFIYKSLVFIVLLYVICYLLQNLIDNSIKKTCFSINYKEWNDLFDSKVNEDLVIQGSSRAWVHINPQILDSAFNLNSYNLGMDGQNFILQYYRFQTLLEYNKKPEYVIQTLDMYTLSSREENHDYEQIIPYLKEPLMSEVAMQFDLDYRDLYIPMYKYIHRSNMALYGLMNVFQNKTCDNGKIKGFKTVNKPWDTTFNNFKKANAQGKRYYIDSKVKSKFEEFLIFCYENNIKVIFVYTPEYYESQQITLNRDSIMGLYNGYATKYNCPFLDYSDDALCLSKDYFYNSQHLNTKGVYYFNQQLIRDLTPIIIKN